MNSSDITGKSARKTASFPPCIQEQAPSAGTMMGYLNTAKALSMVCGDETSSPPKTILPYTQLTHRTFHDTVIFFTLTTTILVDSTAALFDPTY